MSYPQRQPLHSTLVSGDWNRQDVWWLPISGLHLGQGGRLLLSRSAFGPVNSSVVLMWQDVVFPFQIEFKLNWIKGEVWLFSPPAVCFKKAKRGALSGHSEFLAQPLGIPLEPSEPSKHFLSCQKGLFRCQDGGLASQRYEQARAVWDNPRIAAATRANGVPGCCSIGTRAPPHSPILF